MQITYSSVVTRALIVGLLAGLLAGVYLLLVVEPTVDQAIAIEDAAAEAAPHLHAEEPLFTRTEQAGGGLLASIIFGGMVSFIFGTVYAARRHRVAAATDFRRVLLLAAIAFATTALYPALKYPANPPAVGNSDTIDERTLQYLSLLAFGIVAAVVIGKLSAQLRPRFGEPTRVVLLAIATVVIYGGGLALFPDSPDSIPHRIPAQLVWEFRIQSLGGLALLWAALGLGLGWSIDRMTSRAEIRSDGTPASV